MKERPILFSGEMVRAILDGRKTQTRRVIKPQPVVYEHLECFRDGTCEVGMSIDSPNHFQIHSPYGGAGDRLWVRETWKPDPSFGESSIPTCRLSEATPIFYRATFPEDHPKSGFGKWRPSIFMPRWASRITLEVTGVRVERVQDISCADCIAEGIAPVSLFAIDCDSPNPRDGYKKLWDHINAKRSHGWDTNPWVWVIEFRRISCP